MATVLSIGQVAQIAGCNVRTVRYYEQVGLLKPPVRSGGNQRQYTVAEVKRLMFIRHARELEFPLDTIRDLLALSDQPNQSCETVTTVARAQLNKVERRLKRLTALKRELESMVRQCAGGAMSDCRIVEALADYPSNGAGPPPTG
ncbi:probable transcriptional regulator [alpha proteobacterium BAL199]|nr:probable transcriptional regulator [alpha proteobacterium BAL199]